MRNSRLAARLKVYADHQSEHQPFPGIPEPENGRETADNGQHADPRPGCQNPSGDLIPPCPDTRDQGDQHARYSPMCRMAKAMAVGRASWAATRTSQEGPSRRPHRPPAPP